jgi:hypothetical protein
MPSSNIRYANYQARVNIRRWLKGQARPCWICRAFGKSGVIDYTLPARHPLSFEVDELIPVSKGGSPISRSNVDATHRCCNQWRGNKSVEEVLQLAAKARGKSAPVAEAVSGAVSAISA